MSHANHKTTKTLANLKNPESNKKPKLIRKLLKINPPSFSSG